MTRRLQRHSGESRNPDTIAPATLNLRLGKNPYLRNRFKRFDMDLLEQLYSNDIISELDLHFARFLERMEGRPAPELALAAALLSHATRQGHICLDLASPPVCLPVSGETKALTCPAVEDWTGILQGSRAVGEPGSFTPLVLDGHARLYLHRYFDYQDTLARFIRERVERPMPPIHAGRL